MESTTQTDEQLIEGIKQSDNHAFRQLFDRYYSILLAIAINLLKDVNTAKDAVQEVFLSLWKRRESLNFHTTVEGYLKRAVVNRSLNQIKANKKTTGTEELNTMRSKTASATDQLEASDLQTAVNKALDTLPERCRLVFVLRRMEGLSHKEIAEKMEISTKTVENQLTKALKVLKNAVQEFNKKNS